MNLKIIVKKKEEFFSVAALYPYYPTTPGFVVLFLYRPEKLISV